MYHWLITYSFGNDKRRYKAQVIATSAVAAELKFIKDNPDAYVYAVDCTYEAY